MKLGVFTPLLSKLPLADVLAKLKVLDISTVELATGNYPGSAHCDLGMLEDDAALDEFSAPQRAAMLALGPDLKR